MEASKKRNQNQWKSEKMIQSVPEADPSVDPEPKPLPLFLLMQTLLWNMLEGDVDHCWKLQTVLLHTRVNRSHRRLMQYHRIYLQNFGSIAAFLALLESIVLLNY